MYIDHVSNPDMIIGNYSDPLQFKHQAYEFENEVRIIVPKQGEDWENNPSGIRLPIFDLNEMIQSVVVAPEADKWFYELVEDVTQKYGVTSPVEKSKLTFLPE